MKTSSVLHPVFPVSSFLAVFAGLIFLAELAADWKSDWDALKLIEQDTSA